MRRLLGRHCAADRERDSRSSLMSGDLMAIDAREKAHGGEDRGLREGKQEIRGGSGNADRPVAEQR